MQLLPALVVVASIATVTACGGTSSNYAGMSVDEAASEALAAAAQDAKHLKNPLYARNLRLERVVRGHLDGKDAWVAVLNLGQAERACVWIWADKRIVAVTYNYYANRCTQKVLRAKPELDAR